MESIEIDHTAGEFIEKITKAWLNRHLINLEPLLDQRQLIHG